MWAAVLCCSALASAAVGTAGGAGGPRPAAARCPDVKVQQGTLRGRRNVSPATGRPHCSYQGIPYAKPPVGELRFKDPQLPEPWSERRDATRECSACPQIGGGIMELSKDKPQGEDCLCLNVYVPQMSKGACKGCRPGSNGSLPVMVWIHGGAYMLGSGDAKLYGPDYLMQYCVIVVTLNYRLGPLGFLDLDHPDAPGNAGLKDQTLALRWVKDNIAVFGGDPNNVTIFGESAGAASVHLHLLSPMSKGLFQRAIAQSGTALCPWAFRNSTLDNAQLLAERVGCPESGGAETAACLRGVPCDRLLLAGYTAVSPEAMSEGINLAFVPSLDGEFLTAPPHALIQQGSFDRLPFLTGVNTGEGILMNPMLQTEEGRYMLEDLVDRCRVLEPAPPPDACPAAAGAVRERYFGGGDVTESSVASAIQLMSDWQWILPALKTLRMQANHTDQPQFLYEFGFEGACNYFKAGLGGSQYKGVSHADDIFYLFFSSRNLASARKGTAERKTINRMTEMWTNFAKCGHPTPQGTPADWSPFSPHQQSYLKIGLKLQPAKGFHENCESFWTGLTGSQ